MTDKSETELKKRFREYVGPEEFDKFIKSLVMDKKFPQKRLSFWQESLCKRYAEHARVEFPSDIEGLRRLFADDITEYQTGPQISIGKFIIAAIIIVFSQTLRNGIILSVLIVVIGIIKRGNPLFILYSIPFCFIFGFLGAIAESLDDLINLFKKIKIK